QDWGVDAHVAVPFAQRLRAAGIEVREWFGQWGHTTPDGSGCQRKDAHRWISFPCRYDFAEVLYRYLDARLNDNRTAQLGPPTQVMDNRGYWRVADDFPSPLANWTTLFP